MSEMLTPLERLRRSLEASTILQQKSFIFSVAWWLRKVHGFKKYPDCYNAAKKFIGTKSVVFNVPRWPKKIERGPLQQAMQMFYQLLEQSLHNEEWRILNLAGQLLLQESWYYHKHVKLAICVELWHDAVTDMKQCGTQPYSSDSRALAMKVVNDELLDKAEHFILCDSLEDSGHNFELSHLRTGKHTPACPVLRKIAGIK